MINFQNPWDPNVNPPEWYTPTKEEFNNSRNNLKLAFSAVYIYDGHGRYNPLKCSFKAGQQVQVIVSNKNLLGVQLLLEDKSTYTLSKSIIGIETKEYTGKSVNFGLLPFSNRKFDFSKFDYQPIDWYFELSTQISGAANVKIEFYSNWIEGMPIDPNHPNYR
jgi:hypothetical protein